MERYDPDRRFGFIRTATFERLFFHRGGIVNAEGWTPQPGERVTFERERGKEGVRAFRVRPAEELTRTLT